MPCVLGMGQLQRPPGGPAPVGPAFQPIQALRMTMSLSLPPPHHPRSPETYRAACRRLGEKVINWKQVGNSCAQSLGGAPLKDGSYRTMPKEASSISSGCRVWLCSFARSAFTLPLGPWTARMGCFDADAIKCRVDRSWLCPSRRHMVW